MMKKKILAELLHDLDQEMQVLGYGNAFMKFIADGDKCYPDLLDNNLPD